MMQLALYPLYFSMGACALFYTTSTSTAWKQTVVCPLLPHQVVYFVLEVIYEGCETTARGLSYTVSSSRVLCARCRL